jgi:hypothetical protein
MRLIIILALLAASAPLYLSDNNSSETSAEVPYPEGYRRWVHVRSGLTGPESPSFKTTGGLHHIYANDKAIEGYKAGRFPEGSIIVYDLLEVKTKDGITTEGRRRYITVMHKDSQRYTDTSGWGFEVFLKDSRTDRTVGPKAKTQCYECHASQKDKDFVFGSFRE